MTEEPEGSQHPPTPPPPPPHHPGTTVPLTDATAPIPIDARRRGDRGDRRVRGRLDDERSIFRELYPALRSFAAVVGPAETEPDDLVQEALARTLARGPITELDDPAKYLRRVIVNLASNQRRGFGAWRRAMAKVRPETVTEATYPSDLSDLDRLAPLDRAVLFMVEVEGRNFGEVAELTGISVNAARLRASRARRTLRHELTNQGELRQLPDGEGRA